jgi:hypothetical protein
MNSPRRVDSTSFWATSVAPSNFACSGSDGGPVDRNLDGSSGSPTTNRADDHGGTDDSTAALDQGRTAGYELRKQSSLLRCGALGRPCMPQTKTAARFLRSVRDD